MKMEFKSYKGHVLKAEMKKIKEFCLVCYTASFFRKMRPAFFEAFVKNHLCRCDVVHGATSAALMSFLIAYSSHAAAIKDGAAAARIKYAIESC